MYIGQSISHAMIKELICTLCSGIVPHIFLLLQRGNDNVYYDPYSIYHQKLTLWYILKNYVNEQKIGTTAQYWLCGFLIQH